MRGGLCGEGEVSGGGRLGGAEGRGRGVWEEGGKSYLGLGCRCWGGEGRGRNTTGGRTWRALLPRYEGGALCLAFGHCKCVQYFEEEEGTAMS